MGVAAKMYELQKIDVTWYKVKRRLLQIQKTLGENEELLKARQAVADTEQKLQKWRAEQKDSELESRSLAEKIEQTEARLMSGHVRNPKELQALQESLEAHRRHRTSIDNTGVEAMMRADELDSILNEEKSELEEIQSAWNADQKELLAEEHKLKQHYVVLKRKRETLATNMSDDILGQYENMRKRKGGIAVAPIENSVCSACHVQVPTGIISTVRHENQLVLCPSCGRYLYTP